MHSVANSTLQSTDDKILHKHVNLTCHLFSSALCPPASGPQQHQVLCVQDGDEAAAGSEGSQMYVQLSHGFLISGIFSDTRVMSLGTIRKSSAFQSLLSK